MALELITFAQFQQKIAQYLERHDTSDTIRQPQLESRPTMFSSNFLRYLPIPFRKSGGLPYPRLSGPHWLIGWPSCPIRINPIGLGQGRGISIRFLARRAPIHQNPLESRPIIRLGIADKASTLFAVAFRSKCWQVINAGNA